jgi:hypothetical protein
MLDLRLTAASLATLVEISARVEQVVTIPYRTSNNPVVAANDNGWQTALSRENLIAESLLSTTDWIEPRQNLPTGLVLIAVLCIAAVSPFFLLAL